MKTRHRWLKRGAVAILAVLLGTGLAVAEASAKTLNVMTTTEDLASLAREAGGDLAAVGEGTA